MADAAQPLVLVADSDPSECARLEAILQEAGFTSRSAVSGEAAMRLFYAEPPKCAVLEHGMMSDYSRELVHEIKSDNLYGHLPVVLTVRPKDVQEGIDWALIPADDYVIKPFSSGELLSRIRLSLARVLRDVNANPLTGLPGNLNIVREAEKHLVSGTSFAFAYFDLDNFKPFNDKYGFSRGDEVLRMTSRIIVNAVRALDSPGTYVGHIGGDDFVLITPSALMPKVCQSITQTFDLVIPDFYDEEDRVSGCIQSVDRQGNPQRFTLMSCSIGVVDTEVTAVKHVAELFGRVSEVKSLAKKLPGSNYLIDRRK